MTAAWFPILVGSIAFAGPSGMQQMWYTLWLRDKGAGMGVHMPRVRGLLHAGEEETIPDTGSMFDTDDPEEMRKWYELAQVGPLRRDPAVLRHHDAGHDHLHGPGHARGHRQPGGEEAAARPVTATRP